MEITPWQIDPGFSSLNFKTVNSKKISSIFQAIENFALTKHHDQDSFSADPKIQKAKELIPNDFCVLFTSPRRPLQSVLKLRTEFHLNVTGCAPGFSISLLTATDFTPPLTIVWLENLSQWKIGQNIAICMVIVTIHSLLNRYLINKNQS